MKDEKTLYVAFENEFFQGDQVGRRCLGIYSSEELAEARCYELQAEQLADFDPMFRSSFQVVPTIVDEPLEEEDD